MASIDSTARNAAADAVTALLNGGSLRIYDGTPPANAGTALSGNNLLATLPLSATAFGAASAGVATANAITSATAGATGTATFYRLLTSAAAARVQGTVGTSGAELNLSSTTITSGGNVAVSSLTYTQAAS